MLVAFNRHNFVSYRGLIYPRVALSSWVYNSQFCGAHGGHGGVTVKHSVMSALSHLNCSPVVLQFRLLTNPAGGMMCKQANTEKQIDFPCESSL